MKSLSSLLILLISLNAYSQNNIKDLTIQSKIFDTARTISIFLPEAYNIDSTDFFPVAYVFDGQFEPYTEIVSSIMSYYEQTGEGIPMIVVGIHTKNRHDEFIPRKFADLSDTVGGAERLSDFLHLEVEPFIKENYRVNNFRIGIGHSLGGSFVLNELFEENSLFKAVIAASPNLVLYDNQIIKKGEEFLKKNLDINRFAFVRGGTLGKMEINFTKSEIHLDSIINHLKLKYFTWDFRTLEKQNHMTTFVTTFNDGYLSLSSKLMIIDATIEEFIEQDSNVVASIQNYYKNKASFNNELDSLDNKTADLILRRLSERNEFERCIQICDYMISKIDTQNHSRKEQKELKKTFNSWRDISQIKFYDSRAQQYVKERKYEQAAEMYRKAFELNVVRATHMIRLRSVPVLAQVGDIEEAFKQLKLLANYFELGGNDYLINNELCKSLHNDKRWKKYMDKLDDNRKKYQ